jgi:hypothetical protein
MTLRATLGGAGGAGAVYPDSAPLAPSAFDWEFTSDDPNWVETATPSAAGFNPIPFGKYDTWSSMPNPGAAANQTWDRRRALSGFAAGVPFSITAHLAIRAFGTLANNARAAVIIGDDPTILVGNWIMLSLANGANGLPQVEAFNGGGPIFSIPAQAVPDSFIFHAQRDAGNRWDYFYSIGGFSFRHVVRNTSAWPVSFAWVRLIGHNAAAHPTEPMINWVRFNDSRFAMQVLP